MRQALVVESDFDAASLEQFAGGFPNGRRPEDDVVDIALSVATSGALTTDFVPLTDQFLTTFPYLLPPNK